MKEKTNWNEMRGIERTTINCGDMKQQQQQQQEKNGIEGEKRKGPKEGERQSKRRVSVKED